MKILRLIPNATLVILFVYKIFLALFNVLVSYLMKLSIESIYGKELPLVTLFIFMLALVIIYSLVLYTYNIKLEKVRKIILEKLTEKITKNYLLKEKNNTSSGNFINLINEDIQILGDYLIYGCLPLIDFVLMLIFGVLYVAFLSFEAAIFYFIVGLIFLFVSYKNYKSSVKNRENFQASDDLHKEYFSDILKNIPIIKVFDIKSWLAFKNNNFIDNKIPSYNKLSKTLSFNKAMLSGGIYLVQVLSLIIGLILVFRSSMSMANMISIWNAGIGSIIYIFADLPAIVAYVISQKSSVKRLDSYISNDNDFNIKENNKEKSREICDIKVRNIVFSYKDTNIFNDFSCDIYKDKINIIKGKNGSGKTSLINIIMGELSLASGHIDYGNLNKVFSYVPQKNVMFNTTIYENLSLGKDVDKEYVNKLLKELGLFDLIDKLPAKLATIYNDSCKFSEGQLRRLSLIRAILNKPEYIILDEVFSDLDLENQKKVIDILRELLENNIGIILITHTFDFVDTSHNIIEI